MGMPKAAPADRTPRGGPVNIWLPGKLRADLARLKVKLGLSWGGLLKYLYERGGK